MAQKLKIAHLVPANRVLPAAGDEGRYLLVESLIREQVKLGHEITLFASAKSKLPGVKIEAVKEFSFDPESAEDKIKKQDLANLALLAKAFREALKFDLFHSHFNERHLFFAPFVNKPIIVTGHWPLSAAFTDLLKELGPQKNVFLVPLSSRQKEKAAKVTQTTEIVPNGIDLANFPFFAAPGEYLAYLSRLVPEKGADEAIVVARETGEKLKMAGKFRPESKKYRDFWRELEPHLTEPHVEFLKEIPHARVPEFLGRAKALLFPIKWDEPFGLAVVEAMALGTPVIAFNRGSIPDLIVDGKTGFIVKNREEMIAAVKKIPSLDRAACRAHVLEKFTAVRMVANYEKLYRRILKSTF